MTVDADLFCINCMWQKERAGVCTRCGFDERSYTVSPHHLRPRSILNGKYLVGKSLGEGGFGITYLGWDLNLELKVAIKEYYPTGFVTRENTITASVMPYVGGKTEYFQKGRDQFVNEAKRLAKFYTLPGIVSVKDFFHENGTAYIVMEFVEGETLKQRLARAGGRLSAQEMLEMVRPLIYSLAEVHKAGIIHRDISPDNIMLTKEGSLKLLDFGAAREYDAFNNVSRTILVKPGYAPEEQYRTQGRQGPWTDIYSLCATIYRAITGVTPEEAIERLESDPVRPPSQWGAGLTPRQETTLMKGMSVFQQDRFQSVEELAAALYVSTAIPAPEVTLPLGRQPYQPTPAPGPVPAAKDPQKRAKRPIIIGGVAAAAAVILAVVLLNSNGNEAPAITAPAPEISASAEPVFPTTAPSSTPLVLGGPQNGNSPGSLVNAGKAAYQDGWCYYADYSVAETLCKSRSDGSGFEQLSADAVQYINVVGNWVYYVGEGSHLYKIKTDGTQRTLLSNDECNAAMVSGDWIYYANMSDEFYLYKIKADGTERTRLNEEWSSDIYVVGDTIYYTNYSVNNISKIHIDGSNKAVINDVDACFMLNVSDGWIYYRNNSDNGSIYKIGTDGSDRTKVNPDDSSCINVVGERIYYRNNSDNGSIYKINTDGTSKTKLRGVDATRICVVGDLIFYYDLGKDTGSVYDLLTGESRDMPLDEGAEEEYEGIYADVISSVNQRVIDKNGTVIHTEQMIEPENHINFMIYGVYEEDDKESGDKYVTVDVQLQQSGQQNGLYMADYNFILSGTVGGSEIISHKFPVAYAYYEGDIASFPLILNTYDPVLVSLYFVVPDNFTKVALVNTNYFNGSEAGPLYVFDCKETE